MEEDSGKTALWACAAILGLLQAKKIVSDAEISEAAHGLEVACGNELGGAAHEALLAAQWLRQFTRPLES